MCTAVNNTFWCYHSIRRHTMSKMVMMIRRLRCKYVFVIGIFIIILNYFGVFTHMFEADFESEFMRSYPLAGDVQKYASLLESGTTPEVRPINEYNYRFLISNDRKCQMDDREPLRLLILIKSAVNHFDRRMAIRQSWGWEKRFSDVQVRTVFLLGVVPGDLVLQQQVMDEHDKHGDIMQSDFVDTYFNNTIKTMMGLKWTVKKCSNAQFVFFVDDDMYVSVKNLLKFIRYPIDYPKYLQRKVIDDSENVDAGPSYLYAGWVFNSAPQRHQISKWYISLDEYAYDMFPPYVTAGAYVMSAKGLKKMYYTSKYVKHFRFDDVYLGMVSYKAGIKLVHNTNFYFWRPPYSPHGYRYVIASHGFNNPQELQEVWTEQRGLGYA